MRKKTSSFALVAALTAAFALAALPAQANDSRPGGGQGAHSPHSMAWLGHGSTKQHWFAKWPKPTHKTHTPLDKQFVDTKGTDFTLGGKPYAVVGSNNYYPMYSSQVMVDALFEKAAASEFNTMRVWGFFAIGSPGGGAKPTIADGDKGVYFEYWDDATGKPAFNDGADGLERLDYVVAKAKEEGIRLVLPLTNNWRQFGGMDQYNVWAGNQYHSDFYTSAQTRTWFKQWISHLLNRTNTITGIKYKDDPTIMTWELANEPRCVGNGGDGSTWGDADIPPRDPSCTAATLLPWVKEMSSYIKSIDKHHLVATGDEGFFNDPSNPDFTYNGADGVDSVAFSKVKTIDYMSFHLYPDAWGGKSADWAAQFIKDHNKAAKKINKPALMGEFGWLDKSTRNTVYKQWLDASLKTGGAGSLYWILSDVRDDGTFYPDYDGFTVYCPSPVCTTIQNYGKQLVNGNKTFKPVADNDAVTVDFGATASVDVVANDVAYGTKIKADTVDLDPATSGRQSSASVAGGTATVTPDGVVTVVPEAGYSGKVVVPYTVKDRKHRVSNAATLTVTVLPDPNAAIVIEDFAADADGWHCDGTATVASVGGQGVFTNDTGAWAWCLYDLPASLDLSGKDSLTIDFVGTDSGVNPEFVIQGGSGWDWCQQAPVVGTWNTPTQVTLDLSAFTGTCAANLSDVHRIGIGMQAGVHTYDNLKAN